MRAASRLWSAGSRRPLKGGLLGGCVLLMSALLLFEIYWTLNVAADPYYLLVGFLGTMLVLSFLVYAPSAEAGERSWDAASLVMAAASAAVTVYLLVNGPRLVGRVIGIDLLTQADIATGFILVALTLEAVRRTIGPVLALVALGFVAYFFVGQYLPGFAYHPVFTFGQIADGLVYEFDGLFGKPVAVVADYVFLFVAFGALYEQVGGGDFFFHLAAALTGRRIGGPAKVAVIASALYGSISGSPVADVATTGTVTIPAMKRVGFSPVFAGAVEAVASTGGSLLPPVMGAAAFVMVGFTGIPYPRIALASLLPGLLYYFSVYVEVHLHSVRLGVRVRDAHIDSLGTTLRREWRYILPIAAIILLLALGRTPGYAAIGAIFTLLVCSWLKRDQGLTPGRFFQAMAQTCYRIPPLAAAVGAAGLVVGSLSYTGLNDKILGLLVHIPTSEALLGAIAVGAVTILFDMGMPTVAVYTLMAALAAPALRQWGFDVLTANLFLIYFANLAHITPPIALCCYSAAAIADANPMAIASQAVRLGAARFLLPFAFLYQTGLVMEGGIATVGAEVLLSACGFALAAVGFEGLIPSRGELGAWSRVILGACGLAAAVAPLSIWKGAILTLALLALAVSLARARPVASPASQ